MQHGTGRSYEGRPLVRPDEEVVDQGLGFDLATLFSRRRTLGVLGLGAAGVGLATTTPTGGQLSGDGAPSGAPGGAPPSGGPGGGPPGAAPPSS